MCKTLFALINNSASFPIRRPVHLPVILYAVKNLPCDQSLLTVSDELSQFAKFLTIEFEICEIFNYL